MAWLKHLFNRRRRYNELSESIREHLDEKIADLVEGGMPPRLAEQTARRQFGNVTLIEQRSREQWQWPQLESIGADFRYAFRQLLKSPAITSIAVLTLVLGIGANTAIFTLTWNVILKSLPVPHPNRLVNYEMRKGDNPVVLGLSGPEYRILSKRQKSCVGLLGWSSDIKKVRIGMHATRLPIQMLTTNSFHVLEMQPYLGRAFNASDSQSRGSQGVPAILSYSYWQREFHGDDSALGRTLFVDGHPATVVGVMPRAFEGLTANFHPAIYLPMFFLNTLYGQGFTHSPARFGYYVLGRLKPGATITSAEAEIRALAPSIRKQADPTGIYLGQFFKDFQLTVRPGRSGISWMKMVYENPLLVLEFLVLFLLVLCVMNTALVMLARVSGRRHEYALRAALGARKGRLIRQVLVETLLITLPGLVGGIFFGWAAARALVSMLGSYGSPQEMNLHPNSIIVTFNLVSTLVIVFGAGLLPAIQAAGVAPALDLKAVDRSVASKHLGGWVIAVQVAVSLCLVSAAMLFSSTFLELFTAHSGFRLQNAATASVDLTSLKVNKAQRKVLSTNLLAAVQSKPGVVAAGYASPLPLSNMYGASRMFSIDRNQVVRSDRSLLHLGVSPAYFAAAGTKILSGKPSAAPPGAPGDCAIGKRLAQFFFPRENPVGQYLYFSTAGKPDGTVMNSKDSCRVVAVTEEAKYASLDKPAPPVIYGLFRANEQDSPMLRLVVRAKSDALALAAIHEAVAEALPAGATVRAETFLHRAYMQLSRERMLVTLSSSFALLALMLAGLGLYGLLMRSVSLRTREVGIRLALGASQKSILVSVSRRVLIEILLGLTVGTICSVLLSKAAEKMLSLPVKLRPEIYFLSAAVLLCVIMAALYVPARRAAAIDPIQALRNE
jgi:predicted permease